MRVTLIGSSGFLGRSLTEHLQHAGATVNAVSSRTPQGIDRDTGMLPADFSLPERTDAVVYLAQSPHYRQVPDMAWHLLNVNVVSAVRAANVARLAGVKRFIYASTGSVYAPSFAPLAETAPVRRDRWYPLSKLQAEEALVQFQNDMQVCLVRPFGIYGPGQTGMLVPNLAATIERCGDMTLGRHPINTSEADGLKISLCYVDDASAVIGQLLQVAKLPQVVNLAGPRALSVREIAQTLADGMALPARFRELDQAREFDLIADTTQLAATVNVKFTDFTIGISRTIDELRRTRAQAA
jgi:UDP-glucose 4-epimerase